MDIFRHLLRAIVTGRKPAGGYWMIITSCKNVIASNIQESDGTIGTPKAKESGESEGRERGGAD